MEIAKIKEELIEQKKSKFKGNIYHFSQVNFAYNSNKIEGSRISEDDTEEIFESNTIIPKNKDAIKLDDLVETKNHFKMFDYMLDNIDAPLTKEMIITMNRILKRNTTDEDNFRYNVGGFKVLPNKIGFISIIETSAPDMVEKDLDKLIKHYNRLKNIKIEDIIEFHYKFERIHPFGDGNGRVGRMIMFKECLRHNIMPFIILDINRPYYIRGLKEYENDKMYLIDTIKHEQDTYEKICEDLLEFYAKEKEN